MSRASSDRNVLPARCRPRSGTFQEGTAAAELVRCSPACMRARDCGHSAVMVAIPQLAEALAWWPRGKYVDCSKLPHIGRDGSTAIGTEEVALHGDRLWRVVVVDGDRFVPAVVSFRDPDPEALGGQARCLRTRHRIRRQSTLYRPARPIQPS